MANKLPNEAELFAELSSQKIVLSADMWNLIYSNIEDNLTIIRLLMTFHLDESTAVPVDELKKITQHITDVSLVFRKLINPQIIKTEDKGFVKIKEESQQLHPIIKEMFSHYIGNDVQSVNFIIGDLIDDGKPLDRETSGRIFKHINDMEDFLEKLKASTETFEERIKNKLSLPLVYLENFRNSLNEADQTKLDKCIASLQEIQEMIKSKN